MPTVRSHHACACPTRSSATKKQTAFVFCPFAYAFRCQLSRSVRLCHDGPVSTHRSRSSSRWSQIGMLKSSGSSLGSGLRMFCSADGFPSEAGWLPARSVALFTVAMQQWSAPHAPMHGNQHSNTGALFAHVSSCLPRSSSVALSCRSCRCRLPILHALRCQHA